MLTESSPRTVTVHGKAIAHKCDSMLVYLPKLYFNVSDKPAHGYTRRVPVHSKFKLGTSKHTINTCGFSTYDHAKEQYLSDPSFFERDARARLVVDPLATQEEIDNNEHVKAVRCTQLNRYVPTEYIVKGISKHAAKTDKNTGFPVYQYRSYSTLSYQLRSNKEEVVEKAKQVTTYANYHEAYYALVKQDLSLYVKPPELISYRLYVITVQDPHTYATWKEYIRATSEDDAINQIYKNLQNVCITECLLLD